MVERKREIPKRFVGRKIYSISRLTSYHNCQYSYYLNYNLKKKGKPNIYSLLGTKVHSILEDLQENKITREEGLSQFQVMLFEATSILGYSFPSDKVKENFTKCMEHFFKNYKPIVAESVLMEKEFYTEIAGVVLIGYIDVVARMLDGTIEVIDYKTSSKYTGNDLKEHGLQLVLYALALEQEYGVKINKVKWNMLKYCTVRWQGATKPRESFYQRNEVVKKLRSEIKKDLRKLEYTDVEMDILLEKAELANDMSLFPQSIQDKYEITDGYVEYELNDETRKQLEDFVRDTVAEIESKNPIDETLWSHKDFSKDSFFCNILCDNKESCPFYAKYLEQLKTQEAGLISIENTTNNDMDEEMKKLFG
jgi:RecB family exonuclease